MNKYNIVIVANEGYIQHAAVMLCSLFETNPDKQFDIYLLTDGISNETNNRLLELCDKYGSQLIVRMPEKELGTTLGINLKEIPVGQWNTMMYYKLFIPIMLPAECERCLFLDVDMIINDNIEPLYNWNLQDNIIAAAEDLTDCIVHKIRLGLKETDKYINSGVMVCNLIKWRSLEAKTKIFDYVKKVSDIIINEQDIIALYFKGYITFLPIRWNMTTFYFLRDSKCFNMWKSQLEEARRKPSIIHFAAPIKPWFKDCEHPYKYKYHYYLKKTWFNDYVYPYYKKTTYWGKIKKYIHKCMIKLKLKQTPYDFMI